VKPGRFWKRPKQTPKEMREELAKGRPKNRRREEVINELKKLKLINLTHHVKHRNA